VAVVAELPAPAMSSAVAHPMAGPQMASWTRWFPSLPGDNHRTTETGLSAHSKSWRAAAATATSTTLSARTMTMSQSSSRWASALARRWSSSSLLPTVKGGIKPGICQPTIQTLNASKLPRRKRRGFWTCTPLLALKSEHCIGGECQIRSRRSNLHSRQLRHPPTPSYVREMGNSP